MITQKYLHTIYKAAYKAIRIFYNGIPSPGEVTYKLKTKTKISPQIQISMGLYSMGYSIEEIAKKMKVTRERIRQYLIKGCQ